MNISRAIDGFLLSKRVQGCSPNTLRNYRLDLRRFCEFLDGDPELHQIDADRIRAFLEHLMTTRLEQPGVAPRPAVILSAKSLRNVHTTLSSLWTWAMGEGYVSEHVPRAVQVPNPEPPAIEPFTEAEVRRLLDSLAYSLPWRSSPETQSEIPKRRQERDRAILLFLLDTGVRASELCRLRVGDVDFDRGSAITRGKGRMNIGQGKERIVRFSAITGRAISRYLLERDALNAHEAPLFTDRTGRRLERRGLSKHLKRLGQRAGVARCYPHRFRHTFAITYLRNGGDIYTLQELLGHTTLEMVRRYLHLAQTDIVQAHHRASPVSNWRL